VLTKGQENKEGRVKSRDRERVREGEVEKRSGKRDGMRWRKKKFFFINLVF
jgi:hypothetical protein